MLGIDRVNAKTWAVIEIWAVNGEYALVILAKKPSNEFKGAKEESVGTVNDTPTERKSPGEVYKGATIDDGNTTADTSAEVEKSWTLEIEKKFKP